MSLLVLRGAVEQGLIYGLVALGMLLSFRVLNIADLTVDGSFTLGAAVGAVVTIAGHPLLALVAAPLAGALAGCVTAFLQTHCRVAPILAGIITMTGLYSINLTVMGGKANLSLLKKDTVFSLSIGAFGQQLGRLVPTVLIAAACAAALAVFLKTPAGMAVRATGDNRDMVESSSIDPRISIFVGLAAANALAGLSGALLAQYQQFTEVGTGTGMAVIGLASLIIGEAALGRGGISRHVGCAVGGAVVYRIMIAAALSASVAPANLKLVSAVIVAVALSVPALKSSRELSRRKKQAAAARAARQKEEASC